MTSSLCQSALFAETSSNAALYTFLFYILGVFFLAWASNKLLKSKSFFSEYFLGSRGLGVWAFALTFAATSASGGSFTGFPSKIYTHGWVLGLWIGSYIVVPICAMGLLGKRINQVARTSGAFTVPDVMRDRFRSPYFGLLAVSLIVFFMSFNLVAQFKSGSEILKTLLQDVEVFKMASGWMEGVKENIGFLSGQADAGYLICLFTFGVAVIVYTTYGGFHAVVWTDVMQGIVMVIGVFIMLPLAIIAVGGLGEAHEKISNMTPPRVGLIQVELAGPASEDFAVTSPWFVMTRPEDPATEDESQEDLPRLFRVSGTLAFSKGEQVKQHVKVVELTTPDEISRQINVLRKDSYPKLGDPDIPNFVWLNKAKQLSGSRIIETLNLEYEHGAGQEKVYVTGPGPKPASLPANPGTLIVELSEQAEIRVLDANGKVKVWRSGNSGKNLLAVAGGIEQKYTLEVAKEGFETFSKSGLTVAANKTTTVPVALAVGSSTRAEPPETRDSSMDGFLPLSLAISFFFMWAISGAGQPSSMVRLMAFKNALTLRRSIFTVAMYYSMIYFPLVIIFCCARVILPGMDLESDRIMPQMAVTLTTNVGHAWLAGLLVAAPFAAVMSTVDSFLLVISSALVRDVYQRNINPKATERRIKWMCYIFTLLIGGGAMLGAVNPPQFLQDIIVYTGSGLAACFLGPMVFALYWPRANTKGCMAGMIAGFLAHLSMYFGGIFVNGSFYKPLKLFNFNPIIIGLFASFATVLIVSLLTSPPPEDLVKKYFYRKKQRPTKEPRNKTWSS